MLDLGQIRCFVVAATELNFRRAATLLHMTQPPLSRQINLLEHALGVQLFERIGRAVRLTTEGKVFLADAKRLLTLAEQAESTVRRASKGKTGRVRIGFTGAAGYELIPELLFAAKQVLPDVDVVLLEAGSAAQIDAFAAGTIDLGFLRPLPSQKKLEFLLIEKEPLIIALPQQHPLAVHAQIDLKLLHEYPFIMHSSTQGKYFHDRIMRLFEDTGVMPNFTQYIDQTHTILSLVRAGIGVSILPASAQRFRYDKVELRPIAHHLHHAEMCLAWRADQDNPAVTALREMAQDYFSKRTLL
jgi:DNA-binding transcriptional LysR family regulator